MTSASDENLLHKRRIGVGSPLRRRGDESPSGAQQGPCRLFTVAVVGLSGTEKDKGLIGVGKSCLCNRFIRPFEDDYRTEQLSSLSQADFGGPVVNNDHWLYWGDRTLLLDSGAEITFRLIEQTEFVDDESFQPLKGNAGQREPYLKRCTSLRLHSPDKLMYICKDQLGIEEDYEQVPLPDNRVSVDGFVCVYDVSSVPSRCVERQGEFFVALLQGVLKTKKPFVLATTKHELADGAVLKVLEKLLSRRGLRHAGHVIETSAHCAVNTDLPFLVLANMIDRICPKERIVTFVEAAKRRREIIDVATTAYLKKLKGTVQQNVAWNWSQFCRILQDDPDVEHFCDLCGRCLAQKLFQQHMGDLRAQRRHRRRQAELAKLPDALMRLVPDSNACVGKSWAQIVQQMRETPLYADLFYSTQSSADLSDELLGDRLSSDILSTPDAEACFRKHFAYLESKSARQRLLGEFSQLLANCGQVTPGKPLSDVRLFLMGKEPFEALAQSDLQAVYDQYQRVLVKRARRDFIEMLLENARLFVTFAHLRTADKNNAADNRYLHDRLEEDCRYRVMNQLHQWRDNALHKFVNFLTQSSASLCPFKGRCADLVNVQRLIAKARQRMKKEDSPGSYCNIFYPVVECEVKLLIVASERLVHGVARDFENALVAGLFDYENTVLSVTFLPAADSDRFFSLVNECEANGVIVAYSCKQSFQFARQFLARTLLVAEEEAGHLDRPLANPRRLPVVLLYACDPNHLEDMPRLQQSGLAFAQAARVNFVGLLQRSNDWKSSQEEKVFSMVTAEQVQRTVGWLVHCACDHYPGVGHPLSGGQCAESPPVYAGPTAQVTLCLMCGDDYDPDLVLSPLFCNAWTDVRWPMADSFCSSEQGGEALVASVWSLCLNGAGSNSPKQPFTVTLDVFLPKLCQRFGVLCSVMSYHCAISLALKGCLSDGYLLVYSPKRLASLANLDCLSQMLPKITPLTFVAVGESVEYFDAHSNNLLADGARLASERGAKFVSVSKNTEASSDLYASFFEDVLTARQLAKKGLQNEPEYMTLSSFWTGQAIERSGKGEEQRQPMINGQRAPVVEQTIHGGNLFAKRFSENALEEPLKSPTKRSFNDKSVLFRERSVNALFADGELAQRRRTEIPNERQSKTVYGDVAPFDASAPLATPESVDIASGDAPMARSVQLEKAASCRNVSPSVEVDAQALASSEGGASEPPAACGSPNEGRKSFTSSSGPSVAERVRQLTSVLEASYSSEAGARSVPGTPTLQHGGQRERVDNIKSPFFFKTFVLPFRSSSEEYLTEQTDFIYMKAADGSARPRATGPPPVAPRRVRSPGEGHRHVLSNPSTPTSGVTSPAGSSFFVRKVASSFRIRKKKVADESKSLPQSPTADDRVFVLPPHCVVSKEDEEERLSGDAMLLSSRFMPSTSWSPRAARSQANDKRGGREQQVGRRLVSQVSDSMLKLGASKRKSSQQGGGKSIEKICNDSSDANPVPLFVRKCVEFIDKEGLTTEGLYRVPGNQSQVMLIEQKFLERPDVSLESLEVPVNAVTTALKNFFANLSEPLICSSLYEPLINAMETRDQDERRAQLRICLSQLPKANRATLRYFIDHLRSVAGNVHTTAMDHRNIAKCLWPTLVRPEFDSFETMAMMTQKLEDLVLVLLENPSIIDQ